MKSNPIHTQSIHTEHPSSLHRRRSVFSIVMLICFLAFGICKSEAVDLLVVQINSTTLNFINAFNGGGSPTLRIVIGKNNIDWYGGKFSQVGFLDQNGNVMFSGQTLAANNVFFINKTTTLISQLATGFYGGSGNGCNGEVLDIDISASGDAYVGGEFTQAGGFPYSAHIGVFRASGGWNTTYIFTAFNTVDSLQFDGSGVNLTVSGNHGGQVLNYVQFNGGVPSITGHDAVFHTYFGSFNSNAFWTD